MTAATAAPTANHLTEWMTKEDAAALLQCSARSLERRANKGEIETRKQQRTGKSPAVLYRTNDVMRLQPPSFEMPANRTVATIPTAAPTAATTPEIPWLDALAATLEAIRQPPPVTPIPHWLTVAQASLHSGLSEACLKRLRKAGSLITIKDSRQWKYQRADLDRFGAAATSTRSASTP
jgi:hypothetical protein